jgi:hypothetical protein
LGVVLLLNCFATLFMTGVIWFVQLVHYPLFAGVGEADFAAYEVRHASLTTLVVMPPMVIELLSAALLLIRRPAIVTLPEAWSGLGLVTLIWVSTAFLQVPLHNTLGNGFDATAHHSLVYGNWLRTVAWSLRSLLVGLWLLRLTAMPDAA